MEHILIAQAKERDFPLACVSATDMFHISLTTDLSLQDILVMNQAFSTGTSTEAHRGLVYWLARSKLFEHISHNKTCEFHDIIQDYLNSTFYDTSDNRVYLEVFITVKSASIGLLWGQKQSCFHKEKQPKSITGNVCKSQSLYISSLWGHYGSPVFSLRLLWFLYFIFFFSTKCVPCRLCPP